jgi:hypothetical protein
MARLPDASALGAAALPRASSRIASYRSDPGGDAPAMALVQAGSEISQAGAEINRQAVIEAEKVDTLRAEEAYTDLRKRQLDLAYGEKNGFANLKGSAVVNRTTPLNQEWNEKFDTAARDIEASLTNDTQRQKFRVRANVSRLQFDEETRRHMAKESDVYAKEVYEGTVNTEVQNAVVQWNEPYDVAISIGRIEDAVNRRSERLSWPAEYKDAVLRQDLSKVHSAVIQQAIVNNNFVYAKDWFDAHKEQIDLPTSKVLGIAVEGAEQKQLTAGYTANFLAERDNPVGLEQLERTVLADPKLDETRRNLLIGRIQGRSETLDRRAEATRIAAERQLERGISTINANTRAGFEPSLEQMTPLLSAARGTPLQAQAEQMVELANTTRKFRQALPVQQEAFLAQMEAEARKDPTKFDIQALDAFRKIHENQKKQVEESPVTFAVRQGLTTTKPLDLSNPTQAGPALAERFLIARQMRGAYQAPFKPLTPEEASLISGSLKQAGAEKKSIYFGSLAKASNGDMEGYSAIMSQLAPDDPVTAFGGEYAGKDRNAVASLIFRGQDIAHPNKKEDGSPAGGKLLGLPPEREMRRIFDDRVRDAFAGMPKARSDHEQAAKSIYLALSSDAGDRDTSILDTARWEKSINLATGGIDRYRGRNIVLPWGADTSQFKDGLSRRIDSLVESGQLDPAWTRARLLDLPLESVGDGKYVFKSGDSVLMSTPRHDKPILRNSDGSISTERTITLEADGRHYLVPTIVNGKQVAESEAIKLWEQGKNKAVADFSSAEEAERGARARTESLGRALQPRPIIVDFNVSAPFRTSGFGTAAEVQERSPEMREAQSAARFRVVPKKERK